MTNPYAAPAAPGATGDRLELSEMNGALLLIDVREFKPSMATQHGPADAVSANVAVLDGDHKGQEFNDVLLFPKVIVGQLKGALGTKVLARLGQGEKKPGKNPAWILTAATEADAQVAQKYEAYKAKQAPATVPDDAPF